MPAGSFNAGRTAFHVVARTEFSASPLVQLLRQPPTREGKVPEHHQLWNDLARKWVVKVLLVSVAGFLAWLPSSFDEAVNVAASLAAVAALEDGDWLRETVGRLVAERERLARELAALGWLRPLPSRANFVLCRVVGRPAAEVKRALEAEGVLVRYFDKPGLRDCIRISAGRPEDTDRLLAALKKVELGIRD